MKNLKKSIFTNEKQRWSLRKVSVGLASVMLGLTFMTTSQNVKADTVNEETITTQSISNTQITDNQENKEIDIEKDKQTSSKEKNTSLLSDIEKDAADDEDSPSLSSNSISSSEPESKEQNGQTNDDEIDKSSLSDIEKDAINDEKGQYAASDSASGLESENQEKNKQTSSDEAAKKVSSNTKKDIVNNKNNQSLPSHSASNSKFENNKKKENQSSSVIKKDKVDKEKDQSLSSNSTLNSEFKNKNDATSDKGSSSSNNNSSKPSQPTAISQDNNDPSTLKHNSINTSKNLNLKNKKSQETSALEKLKKQNSLKTKELIDQYSDLLKSISTDDWKEGFPEKKDATVKADGMSIEIGKVEDGPFPLVNNTIKGNEKSYTYVNSEGIDSRLGFIRNNQTRPLFLHNSWDSNSEDSYKYAKKNGNLIIVHSSKYYSSYDPDGVEENVEKDKQGIPEISVIDGDNANENYNFSVDYLINEYVIVTPDGDIVHKIDLKNVEDDSNANNNWRYYVLIDTSLNNDDGTSLHSTGKGKNGIYLTNDDLLYGVRGLGDSEVYAVDYSKAGYRSDWRDSDVLASNYNIDEKITGKEHNEIKDTAFRIMTPEMTLKEGDCANIWYYEVPMIDSLNESLSKISDEINKEENRKENEIKQDGDLNEKISNVNDKVVVQVNNVKNFEKGMDKHTPDWLKNTLDLKYSDLLKGVIHLGVKAIPDVGPYLEALLSDTESVAKLTPKFKKTLATLKTDFQNYRKSFKNLSMGLNTIVNDVKNPLKLSKRIKMAISKKVKTVKAKGKAINKQFVASTNKIRASFEKEVSSWLKEIPGLIANNSMLSTLFDKIPADNFIKKYMTKDGLKDIAKKTETWKKAEKNGSEVIEKAKNSKVVKKVTENGSKAIEKVKNNKISKKITAKASKFKNNHKFGTNYIKNTTKESKSKVKSKGKKLIKKRAKKEIKKGINNITSKDKHIAKIQKDTEKTYDKVKKDTKKVKKDVESQVTDWLAKRIVSNFKLFPSYNLLHNVTAYPNEVENRILSTLKTTKEKGNQEKIKRLTA